MAFVMFTIDSEHIPNEKVAEGAIKNADVSWRLLQYFLTKTLGECEKLVI